MRRLAAQEKGPEEDEGRDAKEDREDDSDISAEDLRIRTLRGVLEHFDFRRLECGQKRDEV